ncbi:MAG TPA: hypothetical protein VII38_09910, partial [Polyangia bacterium]
MNKLWAVFAALLVCSGCGGTAAPLPACSAAIPGTPTAALGPNGSSACTEVGPQAVTIAPAADLTVANYVTLGPAFAFAGAGPFPHGVDFVLPYSASKQKGADADVVVIAERQHAPAHAALVSNLFVEHGRGLVHFHATDVATFQVGERADAGTKKMRHYTFRALGGVSMGGFGSSVNFWLHPDRYDAIGVMGADPGPDMTYSLGMIHDYFIAGFCTAADGPNKIGQLCPSPRKPLADQGEVESSFEAFTYQAGMGVGLTLRRQLYLRANRDLARAMGNPGYYNPDSPYLPPGVPASYLQLSPADQCAKPVVLKNFFDARYNPQGTFDVITFCDGNDSQAVGYGKFDPSTPETNPVQILLAVDVNGNGQRDSGEPVIVQSNEPYEDVGTDGKADKDEPGYDPVTNPDPDGDDYHYLWNPTGTEGNWRYDEGEPFQDVGVDGVPMSVGGCPAVSGTPGCYDYGEGNGKFDYAPGAANWRAHDPRTNLEALDPAAFDRLDVYYDAGIRDFFNAQVSTNSLLGALEAKGASIHLYDGFPALGGQAPSKEDSFDIRRVDLSEIGRFGYVRYGDPDAPPATVDATGDGRHVGTSSQAVHRAQTLLNWLATRWPDGDRAIAPVDSDRASINDMLPMQDGRMSPYTVLLPPGYFQPENASKTYPVVYFGHGLGMQPMDLTSIAIIAQQAMVDSSVEESKRMPKFIFV